MISINSTGTKEMFTGAYNARMMENRMREAAAAQQAAPKVSMDDVTGEQVKVRLSPESQAFLDAAPERKAAKQTSENVQQTQSTDPFDGTGDFRKQYLVFSEHLYNNGFYDKLSDEGVRQAENLLKDITSSMDAISPNGLSARTDAAPSHADAQVALASSVEALGAFADQYLEGDLRDSFGSLIRSYAAHNTPIVTQHYNLADMKDRALASLPQTTVMGVLRGYPKDADTEAAAKKLAKVNFSEADDMKMRQQTQSVLASFRKGTTPLDAAFTKLRNTYLDYASGNSIDSSLRTVLTQRSSNTFNMMSSYWRALASISVF